jgi:hypothetical protein
MSKAFIYLRWVSNESISSIKITDGCLTAATANKVRTSFSPSPIYTVLSMVLLF